MEEKLQKLGVEPGSGNSLPHIHGPHGRAVSVCSMHVEHVVIVSSSTTSLFFTRRLCTWGSGPLLHMAGYSSLQGIGISLLKYRWCYESVQNYGTKLEQNVHTIGGLICG